MRSVWDFPRPPAVEPCPRRARVVLDGRVIAESDRALQVLETSHPPAVYIPLADVAEGVLEPSAQRATFCEFKGHASYLDVGGRRAAAWEYPSPSPGYEALRDHVAFYPDRVDACFLGDEQVRPQEGGFYGGWLTADVTGPFKGGPGTSGW